jgi:integrase
MLGRKPNGRPDRPKVIGATRGEVQRRLAELKRKAEQGERTESSKERQSVAQYLEMWLVTARESTRDRSHARYSEVVHRHLMRDFKTALKRAGLPRSVRFHDLRHADATLMLRQACRSRSPVVAGATAASASRPISTSICPPTWTLRLPSA